MKGMHRMMFSMTTGLFVAVLGGLLAFGNASAGEGKQEPSKQERDRQEAQRMRDLGYACVEIESGVYYCCADGGQFCWVRDARTQAAIPRKIPASTA